MTVKVKTTTVGQAKVIIEAASFPTITQIDKAKSWSATGHNEGEIGVMGLDIVNAPGNPGSIIVSGVIIPVSRALRHTFKDESGNQIPKPYCTRISVSGDVRFSVIGTYTVKIQGIHRRSDGLWFYDDERIFTVVVSAEPEPEPTAWEKLKEFAEENPLAIAVGVGSVIGGAVLYQKKSEK